MTEGAGGAGAYGARNYDPLPVTLVRGEGVFLWDTEGKRYLDMLGAYSAASFGHCHPRLVAALCRQAGRLDTISRAFRCAELETFLERACTLTGFDRALPMNTGAEAVETALKAARKWGHMVKGIPDGQVEIIACADNFHGRTITATGLSTVPQYRFGFGPFPPGFRIIPYGDAGALEQAITPHTAAFLVEPIQGEAGIVVPPEGYMARCGEICRRENVLLICDEIQTGLGRTGRLLASDHDKVGPDAITLGKALGGGLVPVSLFLARREVMDVFAPGDHGSTFGGNPIAASVASEALTMLVEERLVERSAELGGYFKACIEALPHRCIDDIRGRGLFLGIELKPGMLKARTLALRLMDHGVLTRDTHRNTVRFAPPLTISREQIDCAVGRIARALDDLMADPSAATGSEPAGKAN